MENNMDTNALLELAVSLGYHLQMCGAEIFRVEEAVNRLLHAYHTPGDVFVIPHCIIVTVCPDNAEPMTRMRRSFSTGLDIDGLERYYGLARQLCANPPPPDEACRMLREVKQEQRAFRIPVLYLGYFLAAGAFSIFFGGTITDGIFAGCIGMLIGWFLRVATKLCVNAFFKTITASFCIAILCQLLTHLTLIRYADAAATFSLGEGNKRVKLYFPWSSCTRIRSMELDDGAAFEPVVKTGKAKKIYVMTYKAKKNEKRKLGHRQPYTKVQIQAISC